MLHFGWMGILGADIIFSKKEIWSCLVWWSPRLLVSSLIVKPRLFDLFATANSNQVL